VKEILKSCKHCGIIHNEDYVCLKKPTNKPTEQFILRSTYRWGKTREQIRKRDCFLCQICLREGIYNCDDIEVHHAIKIDDDKDLVFDSANLITLCREHHRQAGEGEIKFETIKEIIDEQEAKSLSCNATKLSWCAGITEL
jgi:5-methylcytosine-specific restriction endonuclease McrA